MTRTRATVIGLSAIAMWSLLALFTVGSHEVPALQLNAICFAIGGAIGLAWGVSTGSLPQLRTANTRFDGMFEVPTFDEVIALVKRSPGKYSYGSSGVGSTLHFAGELFKQKAGVYMTHSPYRGVAPLTNDLLGNNIEFGVFVLSSGLPHIRAGKVVALGTTEKKRSQVTPDIPALAEHPALKNTDISSWFVLMGPGKLPEPVAAKLKKALAEALQTASISAGTSPVLRQASRSSPDRPGMFRSSIRISNGRSCNNCHASSALWQIVYSIPH